MKRFTLGMVVLAFTLSHDVSDGQQGSKFRGRPIVLDNCAVSPLLDVQVPVLVSGVLKEVWVKVGNKVKKDDVLAVVDDRLARIDLERATAKANDNSELLDAQARLEEAEAQADESKQLFDKRIESRAKYRIALAGVKIANIAVDAALVHIKDAEIEVRGSETKLNMHEVLAPFDGTIVQQLVHKGEAVQSLDPVFRILRTDKVKVDGILAARYSDSIRTGMRFEVYPSKTSGERDTLYGHTGAVRTVKFLPDGKRCASGGDEGEIIIWNLSERERGLQEKTLPGHEATVNCLATNPFDPDRLFSGDADGILLVWSIEARKEIARIKTRLGPIRSIVLHPKDPNFCYTGHENGGIHKWDLKRKSEVAVLGSDAGARFRDQARGHTNYVTSLAITPGGDRLLSAGSDHTLRLWDLKKNSLLWTLTNRSLEIHQIGLSPDGSHFLFNSLTFLQVRRLEDHQISDESFQNQIGSFSDVAIFSPTKGLILTAADTRELQLWQMEWSDQVGSHHQRLVRTYEGHVEPIHSVDFSPDGRYFVSGSSDRTVRVWPVPSLRKINGERKRGDIRYVSPDVEAGSQTLEVSSEVNNSEPGIEVRSLVEGQTPANQAGLNPGDIILAANEIPIDNADQLREMVGKTFVGSKLVLRVLRGEEEIEVPLAIDELELVGQISDDLESTDLLIGKVGMRVAKPEGSLRPGTFATIVIYPFTRGNVAKKRSAVSGQQSAVSSQRSAVSGQRSAVSSQR